nr:reverse transcriptase domain-containing protein [Tanacetum cinerariifolium]
MRTRSRSRSRNNFPQREASPAIIEPLRIEIPFLEDQFQEDPPPESPMVDNRTMAELLQAPTEGYKDAIVIPEITANNFKLKHEVPMADNRTMAQLLQAPTVGAVFQARKEDPHAHIRYFNKITSTMRVPNVPNSTIKLMLFPFSLEGAVRIWLEKEPPRFILTWNDLVSKFINQFFPPSKTTNLRNEITRFQQRFDESFSEAWDRFNDLLRACPHHEFSELHQLDTFYNALNVNDQDSLNSAAGGNILDKMPSDCLKIIESKSKVCQSRAKAVVAKVNSSSSTPAISSDVAEIKDIVKALLLDKKNQSSAPAPSPTPAPVKAVESNCVTCGGTHSYQNCPATSENGYQDNIQNAPMPNLKPSIPYPSRHDNERRRKQANEQIKKFYEIFKDMSFEISFTDALILMPKFASTLKALIGNKEKLSEMARTPIPCEFPGMDECLALADLGASINLMPLSVWKELSLPELTPTCMTLELVDRSVSKPIDIAKDTGRALIDVHKGELTLRTGNKAITYNLDQTSRYSANYDQMTENKIDVTDEACEEYSQEVLGFSDVTASGSPTLSDDPIISTTSPTLTPFGDSDFLLFEEANAFLGLEDDPDLPELHPSYYDPEEDIQMLEAILNSDPAPSLPDHEQSVLKSHKRAIAWKLSDIQGINPEFCTHKILIPWVSPVHCVPKKGGFIVVKNEENELIPTRLVTRWREKSHFMVKEGIVLSHKVLRNGIEVNKAKVDVITKLPHPTTVKGVRSFLDHAGFYRRFIKDFSKISRPMTHLLEKDTPMLRRDFSGGFCSSKSLIVDTKGAENLAADHLSRLEKPYENVLDPKGINETFPLETLSTGIDFMGPFPSSRGNKYILVAVDYLSKWVEAKALPTNDARVICKFLKSLFARFGTPRAIISDRGTHFCNDQFAKVMRKYGVTHRLSTAYHPQISGQVEVSNRCLKRILERTIGQNRASWSDKLNDALWAFRTAYKTRIHDSKIKNRVFNVGDRVLLFNSRLKIFSGKLKTRWSGPFTIAKVFPYGTVELSQANGTNFKVNGHRIKHYFEGDVSQLVVPDLQTFPP